MALKKTSIRTITTGTCQYVQRAAVDQNKRSAPAAPAAPDRAEERLGHTASR